MAGGLTKNALADMSSQMDSNQSGNTKQVSNFHQEVVVFRRLGSISVDGPTGRAVHYPESRFTA